MKLPPLQETSDDVSELPQEDECIRIDPAACVFVNARDLYEFRKNNDEFGSREQ